MAIIRIIETDSIVAYNGKTLTYYPKNSTKTASINGKLLTISDGSVQMECAMEIVPGDFIYHTKYKLYGIVKKVEPLTDNRYRIIFVISDCVTRKYMIKNDYCDTDSLEYVRFMTNEEKESFLNKLSNHYVNYVVTDNKIYRRGVPTRGEYIKLVKWGTMNEIYCITGIGLDIAERTYNPVVVLENDNKGKWTIFSKQALNFNIDEYIMMPCSTQEIELMNKVLFDANYIFNEPNLCLYALPTRNYQQTYYYITDSGNVECSTDDGMDIDNKRYKFGNYFPNENVARCYADKIIDTLLS